MESGHGPARCGLGRRAGVAALAGLVLYFAAGNAPARAAASAAPSVPDVVAVLELGAGANASFILRGTVPVPQHSYPRPDGLVPFSILDYDGTLVPTQVEIVSRYPQDSDGADVVEVLGRVRLAPGTALGARVQYKIVENPHTGGLMTYTPPVDYLIAQPGAILVVATDCFGHKYAADLLGKLRQQTVAGKVKFERRGDVAFQVAAYDTMVPNTSNIGAPNGALQHFFGVHGYFTAWANENVLSLDLRINNGASGLDKNDPIDNPLGKVYFKSLELWVPQGWNVLQSGADPLFGATHSQGTWIAHSLVDALPNGQLHVMLSQGQMIRRLILVQGGNEARAQSILDEQGLGFCRRGMSPTSGEELYSWWNPLTARYFPQRHRLPELDHLGAANMRSKMTAKWNALNQIVVSGQMGTQANIQTTNLGWAHPWGSPYGGMTGGTEIQIFDGVVTADAASNEGYRFAQMTHRLYADRQPDVLFNKTGKPTQLEDWITHGASFDYVNMFFQQKLLPGNDPFGYAGASLHQVNYVAANVLAPAYEATLAKYKPIDFQHYIRYTRSPKVLVWLGNDALAKDDLRMRSELFRLSYHSMANNQNGAVQGGGLLAQIQYCQQHPGRGFQFGRGEGWGIDVSNANYSISDPPYRAVLRPWFGKIADLVSNGQSSCNGYVQAQVQAKMFHGQFYGRAQFENAIVENALMGMLQSVFLNVDSARVAELKSTLVDSTAAMISTMAWDTVQRGPWKQLAVAPLNLALPPYCNVPPPAGGTSTGVDKYQCWSSFAYGYELTGNQALLDHAGMMLNIPAANLKTVLQSQGYSNLDNRAALLALAQRP
jgi:hypothetical protein